MRVEVRGAVVRPTAGVAVGWGTTANVLTEPPEKSTMLEPVPCWLAALLKLLTSTSPRRSSPEVPLSYGIATCPEPNFLCLHVRVCATSNVRTRIRGETFPARRGKTALGSGALRSVSW